MQTKFNIGDEVRNFSGQQFEVRGISISSTNRVDYSGPDGKFFTEELLTLIRPKGCPFKVGDFVTDGTVRFYVQKFENQLDYVRAYMNDTTWWNVKHLNGLVSDECPTTDNARTHIDELRSVLDKICSVLKLPGSPSYLELPKIIATRLEHLDNAYNTFNEMRKVLDISSSSSPAMIVQALKKLHKDCDKTYEKFYAIELKYEQESARWQSTVDKIKNFFENT